MQLIRSLVVLAIALGACEDASNSTKDSNRSDATSSTEQVVAVQGTLAVETESADGSLLQSRKVDLKDAQGNLIASTVSDNAGNFTMEVPGSLAIDTDGAQLLGSELILESLIEDDGSGKVLAVKEPLTIDPSKVVGGKFAAGTFQFKEVAAIRGQVQFVDSSGEITDKINPFGTEVFLAGVSIFARTDVEGKFLLLYIPPGDYSLTVLKDAIRFEKDVTVAANQTLNLGIIKLLSDTDAPRSTASLGSTDFRNPTCVELEVNEPNAKIYYTLDGSTPTATESFLYDSEKLSTCGAKSCPICLEKRSITLKFFAADAAGNIELLNTNFYFQNERWADPDDKTAPTTKVTADDQTPAGERFVGHGKVEVRLQANEGADIYYTVSDDPADAPSTLYSGPLALDETKVISYRAIDWSGNKESVKTLEVDVYRWKKLSTLDLPIDAAGSIVPALAYDPVRKVMVLLAPEKIDPNGGNETRLHTYEWADGNWEFKVTTTQIDGGTAIHGSNTMYSATKLFFNPDEGKMVAVWTGGQKTGVALYDPGVGWDGKEFGGTCWPEDPGAEGVNFNVTYLPSEDKILLVGGTQKKLSYVTYDGPDPQDWSCALSSDTDNLFLQGNGSYSDAAIVTAATLATDRVYFYGAGNAGQGKTFYLDEPDFLIAKPEFTMVATPSIPPFFGPTAMWHEGSNELFLFGGRRATSSIYSNELWAFRDNEWVKIPHKTAPSPRSKAAVAYDPSTESFFLVGGISEFGVPLDDTWLYSYAN